MGVDDEAAASPTNADETSQEPGSEREQSREPVVESEEPTQADADAVESLRSLVVYLVENLIDEPERAEVIADHRGSLVQIQVRLPEEDLGKVIGRGGRIAKAMRTALMISGSRHHLRVSLDIES